MDKEIEKELTELCHIAYKYGADKCPQINHCYTPFYYEYLKDKKWEFKKILEIGVGNYRIRKQIPNYTMGASLHMWRDFFPAALVYGVDIVSSSMFQAERITTYLYDERNPEHMEELIAKIGSDIDLVIDDASHHVGDQITLFKNLMPLLNPGVIYIVEDCRRTRQMKNTFSEYKSFIPQLLTNKRNRAHDGLIVFEK